MLTLTPSQESQARELIAASAEANSRMLRGVNNAEADGARADLGAMMLLEEIMRAAEAMPA